MRIIFNSLILFIHLLLTCHTLVKLFTFLSLEDLHEQHQQSASPWPPTALLWNFCLIVAFVIQHSLLKTEKIHSVIASGYSRVVYIVCTNISILALIKHWQHVPVYLWTADGSPLTYNVLLLLHGLAWYGVYGSSLILDMPDLLGVKDALGLHKNQSPELGRFLSRIPHGSYSALSFILWARSSMSVDRLALAAALTSFMWLRWRPSKEDLDYHQTMWKRKMEDLQPRGIH